MLSAIRKKFLQKPLYANGLDIGTHSIKLLQLSLHDKHYQVETYAEITLASGVITEKEINNETAVIAALRQLRAAAHTTIDNVVLGLPDVMIINKIMKLDTTLNAYAREAQILFAATQYIPYSPEEIRLDFQILTDNTTDSKQRDVLLVASHKAKVERLVNVVRASGLYVSVVDVESFALERAYLLLQETELASNEHATVILFNIGVAVTTLVVLHNGVPIFTRNERLSGHSSTQTADSSAMLPTFIEAVLLQLHRGLQFFLAKHAQLKIDCVLLAGGNALLPGLLTYFRTQLDIEVALANPFAHLRCAAHLDQAWLQHIAPQFVQACGLALHQLRRDF